MLVSVKKRAGMPTEGSGDKARGRLGRRAISDILLVVSSLMPDGQRGSFSSDELSIFMTHN